MDLYTGVEVARQAIAETADKNDVALLGPCWAYVGSFFAFFYIFFAFLAHLKSPWHFLTIFFDFSRFWKDFGRVLEEFWDDFSMIFRTFFQSCDFSEKSTKHCVGA